MSIYFINDKKNMNMNKVKLNIILYCYKYVLLIGEMNI